MTYEPRLYPSAAELLVLKAMRIALRHSGAGGDEAAQSLLDELQRLFGTPEARAIAARYAERRVAPPVAVNDVRRLAEKLGPLGMRETG